MNRKKSSLFCNGSFSPNTSTKTRKTIDDYKIYRPKILHPGLHVCQELLLVLFHLSQGTDHLLILGLLQGRLNKICHGHVDTRWPVAYQDRMLSTSRYVNSSKQRTPQYPSSTLVSRTMAPPAYFANLFCGVASVLEALPPWSFCLPSRRTLPDLTRMGRLLDPTKNTLINWEIYRNLWKSMFISSISCPSNIQPHLFGPIIAPTPPWHPRSHA